MNQNGLIQKTNRPVLWMMTIQLENLWHELHYTNILCCTKANAQKMLQKIFFCCIFFIKMFSLLSFNLEKNLNKRTVHKKISHYNTEMTTTKKPLPTSWSVKSLFLSVSVCYLVFPFPDGNFWNPESSSMFVRVSLVADKLHARIWRVLKCGSQTFCSNSHKNPIYRPLTHL